MNEKPIVNEGELNEAINLINELLGVEARKPGTAARLPAVIRVLEKLEPAGGPQFPVFPASYAGDGQKAPPVYDLNGIEYGPGLEVLRGKEKERYTRQIVRARHCTIDSPQSQANRTETAFTEDEELRTLVPQANAIIPRNGQDTSASILCLPHRVADFRVRLSGSAETAKMAIEAFAKGDALKLLKIMPTSIVFGFWDSRGEGSQHKHARLLLSRIDAFNVIPCTRHAVYSGPYSKDEFAQTIDNDVLAAAVHEETGAELQENKAKETKKALDRMAQRGFTNALSGGLGGIIVEGEIERLSLISLTDIARLCCAHDDETTRKVLTNASRRYIFALALLAEAHPRASGSHRLRSGCELITIKRTVEFRGAEHKNARALLKIIDSRETLIAVAKQAMQVLEIPEQLGNLVVTIESLKADFQEGGAKSKAPTAKKKNAPKETV